MRQQELTRTRTRVLALVTVLAVLCTMTAAAAQDSVDLFLDVDDGTRVVTVTDVSGQPLTDLNMTPGEAETYKVTVDDTNYSVDEAFQVDAENGNLYLNDDGDGAGVVYETTIESDDVSIATSPGANTGLSLDLTPTLLLNFDSDDCGADLSASSLDLVTRTLLCSLILDALNDADAPLSDLEVSGTTVTLDDLTGDLLTFLNLSIGDGGNFPDASYIGIGAGDPAATGAAAASTQTILRGGFDGLDAATLTAVLTDLATLDPTASVSDIVPAATIISSLVRNGAVTAQVLATTLSRLTPVQQNEVIDALFGLTLGVLDVTNLSNLLGSYAAFPSIMVEPDAATVAGTYSGTHTVTIVSP